MNQQPDNIFAHQALPCPHYANCGGCVSQHLSKQNYLLQKQNRLRESLSRAGYCDISIEPVVEVPAASRRRVEFKVKVEKGTVSLGFYRASSHEVVDIEECPVTVPEFVVLVAPLKALLSSLKKIGNMIAVQVSAFDTGIELFFKARNVMIKRDLERLKTALNFPEVMRVAVSVNEGSDAKLVAQNAVPQMYFGTVAVDMPLGAFMQATAKGQEVLTDVAMSVLRKGMRVADLYSGCGTYSFSMAKKKAQVFAYEGMENMMMAASSAAKQHGLEEQMTFETRDLIKRPLSADKKLSSMDMVVINPPRAGASRQSAEVAKARVKHVVMISCNPQTLSHDLKYFKQAGYRVERAIPVDQFLWTAHLESVVVLSYDE